jgi:glutamyl-tRNA synthetase
VGLVVDGDGRRLSKRFGATPIEALRESGRQPEEIIGRLAHSLGLTPTAAPTRARDLVFGFELAKIDRAPFVWDPKG